MTPHDLDHYLTRGWVVIENVFSVADVEADIALAMEISQQELDASGAASNYTADVGADGTRAPRKVDGPFAKHAGFRSFVLQPRLRQLVSLLMGCDAMLATDQIFMKPPRFGSAKPYHQDNFYFRCAPPEHVITAWIALDDVDVENGCLRYIDGSHIDGLLHHEPVPGEVHNLAPDPALIDRKRESLALVKRGGVVFHHGLALHTSHRNESNRWRRAHATHWLAPDVTCETKTLENAYFRNPTWASLFPPRVASQG